ncbi:hypothetical protein NQ317_009547 [Molorchus minor]|uniref:Putative nuclease HARBI1 n=1 Tax=Molorchus minor TaxID=1323400 RepID=A0ABQ9J8P6_9CUCU|nr:hypothetical protein NQ317_009547 [Molorchus minor]
MMLPYFGIMMQEVQENERQENIAQFNIERRIMRNNSDPFSLSDTHFVNIFRLNKDMVNYLIQELTPHMPVSMHPNAVDPQLKILATLYFFANGSYQRVIGNSFLLSMAQNTISNCVNEVSSLIVNHLSDNWILFPSTREDKLAIKEQFMAHTNFPGVIGAVDCTHVAIVAPLEEEHNYINRKGYHSKNVQVVCDYNLRILNINPQFPGSTHDSYIWRMSQVQAELERCFNNGDHNSWLLGDSGYPQQPWLMTPILHPIAGTPEEQYNNSHASARNCIERCFGVLKGKFRCLLGERVLRYSPEKVGTIAVSCAVLHNICIAARLEHNFDIPEQAVEHYVNIVHENYLENNVGREARRQLIERYFI